VKNLVEKEKIILQLLIMIHEFTNRIEVITPKGEGIILYLIDYGHETDTIYTIIINATGELWQFSHKDIIVKPNITFKRYGKD
jgi:hypothetical protein